jgi:hypothetical protein
MPIHERKNAAANAITARTTPIAHVANANSPTFSTSNKSRLCFMLFRARARHQPGLFVGCYNFETGIAGDRDDNGILVDVQSDIIDDFIHGLVLLFCCQRFSC